MNWQHRTRSITNHHGEKKEGVEGKDQEDVKEKGKGQEERNVKRKDQRKREEEKREPVGEDNFLI